jgi:murein DD-endopeptidase / murein LD-carboxypeptidase
MFGSGAALLILASAFAPAPIDVASAMRDTREYSMRERLEDAIEPWLGTRYAWGKQQRRKGTDCSAFVQAVVRDALEIELPRNSRQQYKMGRAIRRDRLRLGDLIFFDLESAAAVTHVGIYMGGGRFAHASRTYGVRYDDLRAPPFWRGYRGARRLHPIPESIRPEL